MKNEILNEEKINDEQLNQVDGGGLFSALWKHIIKPVVTFPVDVVAEAAKKIKS